MEHGMNVTKRTDAERIGFMLGWDIADVRETRYQPSKYKIPVYTIGNDYMCVPRGRKLPEGFNWKPWKESYNEMIYISEPD